MSTAKLREALWDMEHYGAGEAPDLARAARAELEAIEKAAVAIVAVLSNQALTYMECVDADRATELMRAIASQHKVT